MQSTTTWTPHSSLCFCPPSLALSLSPSPQQSVTELVFQVVLRAWEKYEKSEKKKEAKRQAAQAEQ